MGKSGANQKRVTRFALCALHQNQHSDRQIRPSVHFLSPQHPIPLVIPRLSQKRMSPLPIAPAPAAASQLRELF